jgi:hypothetical protein
MLVEVVAVLVLVLMAADVFRMLFIDTEPSATRSAGTTNFNPEILRFQINIDIFGFRQHGYRGSRSMNPALRFGRGDALHAMNAALKSQFPENVLA